MNTKNTIGHITALFTVIVWGTTFISTKILLDVLKPVEILFYRFVIALILLFILYPHFLRIKEKKRELLFIGAGISGVTLYYLLENIALTYTMASNVAVIVSTVPFFTGIISRIFLKESDKLKSNFFIGFILAIVGIFLISFNGNEVKLNPTGDILALLSAIVWSFYSVITKKISSYGYNTVQVTRRIFLYALIFMLPLLPVFHFNFDLSPFSNKIYLGNILFLGFLASGICFVTWNYAVKILGAVKTCIYIYIQPVVTIVTAFIILGERFTSLAVVGTVFTLLGLVISQKKSK